MPGPLTITSVPVGRTLLLLRIRSSPSVTVVDPVYVLLFANARTPAPALVSELPEIFVAVWTMLSVLAVVKESVPPPSYPVVERRFADHFRSMSPKRQTASATPQVSTKSPTIA